MYIWKMILNTSKTYSFYSENNLGKDNKVNAM